MSMMFFLLHQNYCWNQSAPLFSVGNDGEVDKGICQFELPNGVKYVMRRSPIQNYFLNHSIENKPISCMFLLDLSTIA